LTGRRIRRNGDAGGADDSGDGGGGGYPRPGYPHPHHDAGGARGNAGDRLAAIGPICGYRRRIQVDRGREVGGGADGQGIGGFGDRRAGRDREAGRAADGAHRRARGYSGPGNLHAGVNRGGIRRDARNRGAAAGGISGDRRGGDDVSPQIGEIAATGIGRYVAAAGCPGAQRAADIDRRHIGDNADVKLLGAADRAGQRVDKLRGGVDQGADAAPIAGIGASRIRSHHPGSAGRIAVIGRAVVRTA